MTRVCVRERPAARLAVEVLGPDGRPTPARVYVTDARGDIVVPPEALAYRLERPFGSEAHAVTDGRFAVEVPAGPTMVRVERGPEFRPVVEVVDIATGDERDLRLRPERWVDMAATGWFPGDLHGHRRPQDMPTLMAAEELHVGSTITSHNGRPTDDGGPSAPWLRGFGAERWCSTADVEVERLEDGVGAFVGVGVREPLHLDVGPWEPADTTAAARVRAAGGHVDVEKPFWRSAPVLVALGLADSVGVACNHFGRTWAYTDIEPLGAEVPDGGLVGGEALARWVLELYDRFLDGGARVPVSGGSASGWMPNPLGSGRTYVHTTDQPLDHGAWLRALRRGRSFATTGPMLWFDVAGHGPGAILPRGARVPVPVVLRARAAHPLGRLEVVRDGEVVADADLAGGASGTLEVELDPAVGGWLVGRAFGSDGGTVRFASTSPVYLGGGRPSARRGRSTALLCRWLEASLLHLESAAGPSAPGLLDAFRRARDVYRTASG